MAKRVRQQHQNEELFDKRKLMDTEKKVKVELRDYFIAAALTGLCANMGDRMSVVQLTELARKIADEMLIERTR